MTQTEINEVITSLSDAHRDISEWLQLARYQREKIGQNLGWCPTNMGIERSMTVCHQIGQALKLLRSHQFAEPTQQ